MKKKLFDLNEWKNLGIMLVVTAIIIQIAFHKDDFLQNLRTTISIFWLFVIPGYFIMLYWKEKLDFLERAIVGTVVSAAVIGTLSYYFGIMGINLSMHSILLPLLIIVVCVVINVRKK